MATLRLGEWMVRSFGEGVSMRNYICVTTIFVCLKRSANAKRVSETDHDIERYVCN
ncbi:MAG: hypothetical protein M0T78_05020 [Actinomycetota bacterium]|nr:hypothetical protein [Actinomycetota bacterium]